jgi:hypothetical protein
MLSVAVAVDGPRGQTIITPFAALSGYSGGAYAVVGIDSSRNALGITTSEPVRNHSSAPRLPGRPYLYQEKRCEVETMCAVIDCRVCFASDSKISDCFVARSISRG